MSDELTCLERARGEAVRGESGDEPSPALAILRGLRNAGDETQLTRTLASLFREDGGFAARFLEVITGGSVTVPAVVECSNEERVTAGRVDLRFRADGLDVIVEVKLYAGYGREWLSRYTDALEPVDQAFVVAITRDVPVAEPPPNPEERWLGAVRWREILPALRSLAPGDPQLALQWPLLLDVLELEGSMGFTQAKPELFHAFAEARKARLHMREFLRAIANPLLYELRAAVDDEGAAFYFGSDRKVSEESWGKMDIPFVLSGSRHGRVRAGLLGWNAPTLFYVQPNPNQRWDRRALPVAAREAVAQLVSCGFDPQYLRRSLPLTDELIASPRLEEEVVGWAGRAFRELGESRLLSFDHKVLVGKATNPGED